MARAGTAQGLSDGNPDVPHEGDGRRLGGHDRVEHAGDETPGRAYHNKNDAGLPDRQVYKGDRRDQTVRKKQESHADRPDDPAGRHRLAGADRRTPEQVHAGSTKGWRRRRHNCHRPNLPRQRPQGGQELMAPAGRPRRHGGGPRQHAVSRHLAKSNERERRSNEDELQLLYAHYAGIKRQKVPMPDLIRFAISRAMRVGEIILLKWKDIN